MKLPLMGGVGPAAETSSHLTPPSSGESRANLTSVSSESGASPNCPWAHGASEAFLRRVRAKADERGGVMIHMHLLQSPMHKAYGLRRHGKPTVFWLDDLGWWERNVVYVMRFTSPSPK